VPALLELGFSPESIYLDYKLHPSVQIVMWVKKFCKRPLTEKEFSGIRLLANIIPIAFGLPNDVLIAQLFLAH